MSKVKDLKNLEQVFDWSFSTPYKGTVRRLNTSVESEISDEVAAEIEE